ncbi:uncharacterized protein EDB93DRAFT_1253089 [Suillus bovinus]|uniref:uncharacterized protein n=1 Tax=Suillus bovinus TaxID=48563 RepID=UPI001B8669F8|nr:uncharacterized protein EDB93DRAFT_1253089 [Suillus bovinus]KAG2139161.1 hypothetical protein EDB93DRAFT_1253089 [Suillus bovinus]
MVPCINSDTEEAPAPRPKRVAVPSAKVISADNAADQELLSHRIAHITNCAAVSLDPTDLDGADNDKIQLVSPHTNKQLIKDKFFFGFMCFTNCNPLTIPTGRKQVAQSPDAEDVDLAQPPASDEDDLEEGDPPVSVKPPKKRQKKVLLLPVKIDLSGEQFVGLPNTRKVSGGSYCTSRGFYAGSAASGFSTSA